MTRAQEPPEVRKAEREIRKLQKTGYRYQAGAYTRSRQRST